MDCNSVFFIYEPVTLEGGQIEVTFKSTRLIQVDIVILCMCNTL